MGALALNREASATSAEVMLGRGPLERRSTDQALIKHSKKVVVYCITLSLSHLLEAGIALSPGPSLQGEGWRRNLGTRLKPELTVSLPHHQARETV